MIGHLTRAYVSGREAARAGEYRPPAGGTVRPFYVQGWSDETTRMEKQRRLAQMRLQFAVVDDAENRCDET